jgi:hypothetical protein
VPERLENGFGLAARVDEHERGVMALDQLIDLDQRVAGGMAGPRNLLAAVEHAHLGRRAAGGHD